MTYRYPVDFTEPDHINPVSQSGNMDVKNFPLTGRRV
ncbi:HNH endonuclease, partial [Escherichia coli]|nr:HNH endonuclease [Escherichia coli]